MAIDLRSLLGIDIPIIQAPTGSIAGPELAAAVSHAGGLGSMGFTWTAEKDAVEAVRAVRAATDRPFMVNYALAFTPASLPAVLAEGVPIVTFSWGDPRDLASQVHAAGALVGVQAANAAGARRAVDSGADFLICQGVEAGGHVQSSTALADLLEAMRAAGCSVPVAAAGGLADGASIARVMRAGADGVMLGTRFVATVESRAHAGYKQRLVSAGPNATALTICFDGGWPHTTHRVLRNATLEEWEAAGCPSPWRRPGEGDVVGTSATGEAILRYEDIAPRVGMTVNADEMALYAGTGVARIGDIPKAGDLVRALWRDSAALLDTVVEA